MVIKTDKLKLLKKEYQLLQEKQDKYLKKNNKRSSAFNKRLRELEEEIDEMSTKKISRTEILENNKIIKDQEFHVNRAKNRLTLMVNLITTKLNSGADMDKEDIRIAENIIKQCLMESKESLAKLIELKKKSNDR